MNRYQSDVMIDAMRNVAEQESYLKEAKRQLKEVCSHLYADGNDAKWHDYDSTHCRICGDQF